MYKPQKKVYLVGFMGSGKSTIGKRLSMQLEMDFVDLDQYIESQEGKSVKQIFQDRGEKYFRDLETTALHELVYHSPLVIALGGGTPCFNDNMKFVNNTGTSIYLKMSPLALSSRLWSKKAHRPLISSMETENDLLMSISEKLDERIEFYEQSFFCVENRQTIDNTVTAIIDLLNS